jgi:flagellar hook-associated protein 1 FlgK
LTVAYNVARDALGYGALASSVVSRNVANADDPNAARKSAVALTDYNGTIRRTSIANAVDNALLEHAIQTTSSRSGLEAVTSALEQLSSVIGDPATGGSVSAKIGNLRDSLLLSTNNPPDSVAARQAVIAASDVAGALHDAANAVMQVRIGADTDIKDGVAQLQKLLSDFESVNSEIVAAPSGRTDITDQIDRRNGLLREISELVDVRPVVRAGNDMVLYLGNGATLFETTPRDISVSSGTSIVWGQPGSAVSIDGVPMTASSNLGGKLGGLLQVRDDISIKFGQQADEIARGLIAATAESDQSAAPSLPDIAGLFTYTGGPALPPAGVMSEGLAASIRVNPNVDPSAGGDLSRLRDGSIGDPGDPSYIYNAAAAASFSDRLRALADSLSAAQPFDPSAGLVVSQGGVLAYASSSAGWLESERSNRSAALENSKVLDDRAVGAWQDRVGINVDDEMAKLIALQQSYQASSRLITAVNDMMDSLFKAMG